MIVKNDPLPGLLRDLPRILAYEVVALGFALLCERHLLRGYVEAARLLPRMRRKRAALRRRRSARGLGALPYGLEPPP